MRVALIKDAVTFWLAGTPGIGEREFSSSSGLRVEAQIDVQEDHFIRATAGRLRDRKNLVTTVSFSTTRKFATATAAELFALDYDRTYARDGLLMLESPQPGGGVSRRYLATVVVRPPAREVIGVTVLLSYVAVGGQISATPPAG